MAQNQAQGGNSMAAMLGNMQNRAQRPGAPLANYGAGMQAPMAPQGQVWRGPPPGQGIGGQAPIPPGGPGYPQMTPQAMQNMMAAVSGRQQAGGFNAPPGQQLQSGAPGNMAPQAGGNMNMAQMGAALGQAGGGPPMPRRPMPAPGAPGMGAGGGKNQQIAQLQGGPPMGR